MATETIVLIAINSNDKAVKSCLMGVSTEGCQLCQWSRHAMSLAVIVQSTNGWLCHSWLSHHHRPLVPGDQSTWLWTWWSCINHYSSFHYSFWLVSFTLKKYWIYWSNCNFKHTDCKCLTACGSITGAYVQYNVKHQHSQCINKFKFTTTITGHDN